MVIKGNNYQIINFKDKKPQLEKSNMKELTVDLQEGLRHRDFDIDTLVWEEEWYLLD